MSRIFHWKKSIPVILAAVFFASGAMGGKMVTAWATPVSGIVNADGVRIRDAAVDGDMLGTLSDGEEVSIADETTGSDGMIWYEITYETNDGEITGWVRSDFLDTSDDESGADTDTADEPEVSYIVADSIPDDVIPDDFEETTITYLGEEVPALYSEACDISLLYAVNAEDETDAGLFVYDEQNEAWIPFVQFEMQDGFVVLLSIPEDEQEAVADRYVLTECVFEHGSISAYQLSEPDELVAADASIVDYYYMYGVNEIGETGWYVYDAEEGSIQKNVTSMQYSLTSAEIVEEVDTDADADLSFSMDSVTRMSIAVLAVICILLLILAVIFSVRYRRLRSILEDETENPTAYREQAKPEKRQQESAEPVLKKTVTESRDNQSKRKNEPMERHFPSDDMDVMDLDSMEDEDYEELLNKYLDENFADEEEESGRSAFGDPDADLSEYDAWFDDPVEEDVPPSEKEAADSLGEDYDMPEFRKTNGDTQGSDDMTLNISGSDNSARKSRGDNDRTDYNMKSALSSKK